MIGKVGELFGCQVVVAKGPVEWALLVAEARKLAAGPDDPDCVIVEGGGFMIVNPSRAAEIVQRIRDAVPEWKP